MRFGLLLLGGCSLAVTHELSPYVVSVTLIVLVVFRAVRPWYVPATCIVPAVLWALLNWQVVASFVTFDDLGNLSNFTPPKTVSAPGLHRLAIVGESSQALLIGLLVLIALAGVGFVATVRRMPGWGLLGRAPVWGFLISAGTGLLLITANSYGNEGIFRAALFAIPWLAALATAAAPRNPPGWMSVPFGLVAWGLLGTFLLSMFGLDNASVIRQADFQALDVYEVQASARSYLLDLSYGDIPVSITFPEAGHYLSWSSMVTQASFRPNRPDAADAIALAQRYINRAAQNGNAPDELYALWSPASAEYSVDYGLETFAQAQAWRTLIAASPDWQVVFNQDGTYLFRVVVPTFTTTPPTRPYAHHNLTIINHGQKR